MIELINDIWPLLMGFVTLVIVLAKMSNNIDILKEKVKTLFELYNNKR